MKIRDIEKEIGRFKSFGKKLEDYGVKVEDIYVDPEDRWRLIERLEKYGVWKNFVSFCKKKNGDRFYTERTTNMIRDEDGQPVLIEGTIRVITKEDIPEKNLGLSEK